MSKPGQRANKVVLFSGNSAEVISIRESLSTAKPENELIGVVTTAPEARRLLRNVDLRENLLHQAGVIVIGQPIPDFDSQEVFTGIQNLGFYRPIVTIGQPDAVEGVAEWANANISNTPEALANLPHLISSY